MVEVAIAVTVVATPILMVVVAAVPMVIVICNASSTVSAACEYVHEAVHCEHVQTMTWYRLLTDKTQACCCAIMYLIHCIIWLQDIEQ